MSSTGPQLPPEPTKRKRTPEDDAEARLSSPPTKQPRGAHPGPRPRNDEEIDLQASDSEDDGYGPVAPAPAPAPTSSKAALGPSLPPKHNDDEVDLSNQAAADPKTPNPSLTMAKAGPALPNTDDASSDSDSDDDYGPALPTAQSKPTIGPSLPPPTEPDAAPQRDSWMVAPPTSTGYSERDPTRMRARKFASKSSAGPAAGPGGGGAPSIWTETPEEKLQRLQNSVLGRSDPSTADSTKTVRGSQRSQEQEDRNRRIAASVEASRGKSLYQEHQDLRDQVKAGAGAGAGGKGGKREEEEDDDPSQRAFDREKDMALGGRLGNAQKRELMTRAANFGGRFDKGSFL